MRLDLRAFRFPTLRHSAPPLVLAALFVAMLLPAPAAGQSVVHKWTQAPDATSMGVDVNASGSYILADDFLCGQTGPITQITIWGSWRQDWLPYGTDPSAVTFTLSIHGDIPAGPQGYSQPDEPLWFQTFEPGQFAVEVEFENVPEGWLNPPESYSYPADFRCWRYTFTIPKPLAFVQQGTQESPVIYWLDVKAIPSDSQAFFGWKTSIAHWNDDAVWGTGGEPYVGPWHELVYPPGHQYGGQSIDLAFQIGMPADQYDFGDAPDNPLAPGYPTLLVNDGARHLLAPGILLGNQIDVEPDGQPDPNAVGDDLNNLADEDGVVWLTPLVPAQPAQVQVTASVAGNLWVWIDFNGNQSWAEPVELVYAGFVPAGPTTVMFNVPGPAVSGPTFARFRFTTAGVLLSPGGLVPDGEVEDYAVTIEEPPASKWRQDPDLGQTGIDVDATQPLVLADDFLCTEQGRITEITVWGSWFNDRLPYSEVPDAVDFILSIHADIPAGPGTYSRPGDVLWHRIIPAYSFQSMVWADNLNEGWMRPPDNYDPLGDTVCWRYTFTIPAAEAFIQTGTTSEPVVYWLDVQAIPLDGIARFGWKTSLEHWNDDAVWGEGMEPYPGPWYELRYPPQHPMHPESIDLAFAIQSKPVVDEWDFGDAPDPAYPTLLASNGARHSLGTGLWFGLAVDAEPDGLPDPLARGDDNVNLDDEDGVAINGPLFPSISASVLITLSQPGYVDGWIDFDGNGTWTDPQDNIVSAAFPAGTTPHIFAVPNTARPGLTFARFRVNSIGPLGPDGPAHDGEVEDHSVEVYEVDWGDAPDNPLAPGYPTLLVNNGARHSVSPAVFLGSGVDHETDGQPDPNALGDDNAGIDDEDGVTWTSPLVPGRNATVDVFASVQGHLEVWIDFDANRSWLGAGENVYSGNVFAGPNTITFPVPAGAVSGPTFARFRFALFGPLPVDGPVTDGEVEDYAVVIERAPELKWMMDPDLNETGVDVDASQDLILADDFECTARGRILDIVVWGSWQNDYLPFETDPSAVDFILSIHADIPADESPTGYSMPGEPLWWRAFARPEFEAFPIPTPMGEWWMEPPDVAFFPGDFLCWQYTFHVPAAEAFFQRGNPDFPKVYWLDVKAIPHDPMAKFGWKSSGSHWNDDGVWTHGAEPYAGLWNELRYPPMHPLAGQSMDLAFAILGWAEEYERDFGDAPDVPGGGGYPTLLVNDGARHWYDPAVTMGAGLDVEADGQPDPNALGDDNAGFDDEDGVTFTSVLRVGWRAWWDVTVSVPGFLDVWLDWNRDGTWAAPGDAEHIVSAPVSAGTNSFSWFVPAAAQPGVTFMRFRFNTAGPLGYAGSAVDGEVEDYQVTILETTASPGGERPPTTMLHPAAPNPFGTATTIGFDLADEARVTIDIFSVDGRRVVTLVDDVRSAGRYEARWNGRNIEGREAPAGFYYVRMNAGSFTRTLRLALLR